jgi:hypothetical protein
MEHHSHAELVSASMPQTLNQTRTIQNRRGIAAWTLNQVQGDNRGGSNGTL